MLRDKVAIVTGGASGIGRAICLELARSGVKVTVNYYRKRDVAEELLDQITHEGGQAQIVQGDVSRVEDLQNLIEQTIQDFGQLDVMVNNAGMEGRQALLDTTPELFDRVISVNLKGAFFGTQLAAKQMVRQGKGGRIINISSIHEDWPMPGNITYCCSKGGMRMLTRTAALELARYGITVVGVGPGAVDTPINKETLSDPEAAARIKASIPLGRVADPREIAALVSWLASDQAAYVTATTYFIDGGMKHHSHAE